MKNWKEAKNMMKQWVLPNSRKKKEKKIPQSQKHD
jgi:hypothetical protein